MKQFRLSLISLLLVSLTVPGFSADDQEAADRQKMMEVWMKYATPGEGHDFLKRFVGEWSMAMKSWMEPGAEPESSKGTMVGKMILGGRYLMLKYTGDFMGMPYEGIGFYAYDNHLKKYISTWFDNMGTGVMVGHGELDESGNALIDVSEIDDIFSGQKVKAKTINRFEGPDRMVMEMYMISPEGSYKNMEAVHIKNKQ